jgi:uncharacterized membrane protein YjfL (UPF0719 family)
LLTLLLAQDTSTANVTTAPQSLGSALLRGVVASVIYAVVGLLMFALAFFIINKAVPFSLRKEIEDQQNPAIGVVIACVIIGIAMVVSAAVHG